MKRRNFVKASVVGASVLAFTPVTSLFAQKISADKFTAGLNIANLDPKVSSHYVKFSEDFFAGLPTGAKYDSGFSNIVLPKKTLSYECNAKGYELTFLNLNGDKVSFIKKGNQTYTLINAA